MSKDTHNKCSKVLRNLRFDWVQDPEVVLNEKLKTVDLTSEYLETDLELFKVFHDKLYRSLERKYRPLLDLVVPAHFIWQTNTMWIMLKRRPINENTYDQTRKAILTPQPNDEYDYESSIKGPNIKGQNTPGPDTLCLLEHERIQEEFHPDTEQIEAFCNNIGVDRQ